MPRAFDRLPLSISNDPNQGLEFHPQSVLKQAAGMWQTIIDAIIEQAEALIKELIQRILGLDIDPFQAIEDLWNQLSEWVSGIPVLSDLLEAITGIEDGDLNDLGTFFLNLRTFFQSINFFDGSFDLEAAWSAFFNMVVRPFLNSILSTIFGGLSFDTLPTPEEIWSWVADTFLSGIFSIPADVQESINAALGDLQDALDGSYSGSGPIFLAVQALAEAWLKATDPLNAANLFGRISLPQFGSGVPIMALTTAVPNELEPFSAASVPTADGWSFNAGQDAAQVVADGSTKTLYLQSGVIKVEAGQPLDTGVSVTYSGVSSGAGQAIRYVLETFTSDDGSGTATPVTIGSVSGPSGTITTPVSLSNSSWAIPAGVQSVRPVLVVDSLVTAGTVFWKNTPSLKKKLAGPLSGGLPAAIQDRIDDFNGLLGDLLSNPAGVIGTITQGMVSGLPDLNTLTNQIRDILAGLVVTPINSTVQAIKDWFTGLTGKTANLTTGGLFDAAKLSNITGTISQSLVTGLTGSLGDLQTTLNQIGDIFNNAVVTPINSVVQSVKDWWNEWFGGGSSNAIPLSQKGAANGVAPLDSSSLIPAQYIPGGVGGGGEPTDHILFTLAGNQSIPSGTATALAGWQQVGSVTATFDDGTNTRWTFPKAGWWDIQSQVVWDTSTTGKRQSAIVRTLSSGSVIPATDGADAADCPAWPVRNKIRDTQEVGVRSPLAATDKFSIEAYQNSGAALNAVAGYPDGTYVLATYLGQRQADAVTVMPVAFDARGGGGSVAASGSATTTWSHTATGLDRFVIVFAAFKPSSVTGLNCTASYGGVGMTRVAFLTSSSNVVLAAFVMEDPPTGAKTISVTASNSSGSVYLIADSLSYTGVGGYTVSNTALTSSTAMSQSVSSAANRMVAQAFAADGSNGLSAYSQTQRLTASYSSFVRMVAGDAAGAGTVNFTGTSSGGSSKYWGTAIDLHQVSV